MMKWGGQSIYGGLVILTLGFGSTAWGATESDREIAVTYANHHIQQKNFKAAEEILSNHLSEDSKDHGAWNLMGLTYLELGENEKAASAFKSAAQKTPKGTLEYAVYLYNFADALIRQGNVRHARRALLAASWHDRVNDSAENAIVGLSARKALPPIELKDKRSYQLSLSLSGGYDTNVSLANDDTLATGAASNAASPTSTVASVFGTQSELWSGVAELIAMGSYTLYTNSSANTYNTVYAMGEFGWSPKFDDLAVWTWRLSNVFDASFLNSDGMGLYNLTEQVKWSLAYAPEEGQKFEFIVPLRYQYYPQAAGASVDDNRTGLGIKPQVAYTQGLGDLKFNVGVQYDFQATQGVNYRASIFTFPLGISWDWFWDLNISVMGEYSRGLYDQSTNNRSDHAMGLGVRFTRKFGRQWMGALDFSTKRSVSTVSSYTYSKYAGSVLMTYLFF